MAMKKVLTSKLPRHDSIMSSDPTKIRTTAIKRRPKPGAEGGDGDGEFDDVIGNRDHISFKFIQFLMTALLRLELSPDKLNLLAYLQISIPVVLNLYEPRILRVHLGC